MRNPGTAKGYFELISLGCSWSIELRAFMFMAIAGKLAIDPRDLPRMKDDELWQSFKTATETDNAALSPSIFNEHRELASSLSIGETVAITMGRGLNSPMLPEGVSLRGLLEHIGADWDDEETQLSGAICVLAAQRILLDLEHPAILDWRIRHQRYSSHCPRRL